MQSLIRAVRSKCRIIPEIAPSNLRNLNSISSVASGAKLHLESASKQVNVGSLPLFSKSSKFGTSSVSNVSTWRSFSTTANPIEPSMDEPTDPQIDVPARIKVKRLDKTAKHIMQILDKEAVQEVKGPREIPDIKPGYVVRIKLEVPENKRRITTIEGIVIARRNSGLNTTLRIRRLVADVGVESLLPLYSPNIKEITVLNKNKVRRAKLYYLRDRMNALKK